MPGRLGYPRKEEEQVGITAGVRKYVAGFKGKTKLERAEAIVRDVASFKEVELPNDAARQHWMKRSAHQIIKTRTFYVTGEMSRGRNIREIAGCSDAAQAVCAALRAINLRAVIVRQQRHTYVKFLYKGEVYKADPIARNLSRKVKKMNPQDMSEEQENRELKFFAEGASPAQIGLNEYATDFYRYHRRR